MPFPVLTATLLEPSCPLFPRYTYGVWLGLFLMLYFSFLTLAHLKLLCAVRDNPRILPLVYTTSFPSLFPFHTFDMYTLKIGHRGQEGKGGRNISHIQFTDHTGSNV